MILTTKNYGIAYCDDTTALKDLATVTQQVATTLDAALGRGGVAPVDASSLAAEVSARTAADTALGNRTTALETLLNPSPAPGQTSELPYGTGFTGYKSTPWTGVRYWRRGSVVTIAGPLLTTAATAANAVVGTVPVGFRPPIGLQVLSLNTGTILTLNTDGTLQLNTAQGNSAVVMIPPVTFGAV